MVHRGFFKVQAPCQLPCGLRVFSNWNASKFGKITHSNCAHKCGPNAKSARLTENFLPICRVATKKLLLNSMAWLKIVGHRFANHSNRPQQLKAGFQNFPIVVNTPPTAPFAFCATFEKATNARTRNAKIAHPKAPLWHATRLFFQKKNR